ncbi:tail fiber domain-containing protein [Flavobacterium sp. 3-210]
MKKTLCMLLLVQSGFMIAQTEKIVTANGKRITINPSGVSTADNGLNLTSGNLQLGGALIKPSILTTTSTFTLAIQGLQTGSASDQFLTTDANGVLRKINNTGWSTTGNAGTTAGTNFIGTLDDKDLVFKRWGIESGRISNYNTSFGYYTLSKNTGISNTAFGATAMISNTIGNQNVAVGSNSLYYNTAGSRNVGLGSGTLMNLKTGNYNTALGDSALANNIDGEYNIAIGFNSGSYIVASAQLKNTKESIFIGSGVLTPTNNSINQIVIGNYAVGRGSNTVQIGNEYVTSIGGQVDWSIGSDVRLKKDIVTSTYGLNFINKLRPVTYKLKNGTTDLQSGFIAQEVEAAANSIGYQFNAIVKPQAENDFYSLRYAEFVVPLVKAIQEQQKQIEEKETKIVELEKRVQRLEQLLSETLRK